MTLSEQISIVLEKYPSLNYDEISRALSGYLYASEKDGDKYFIEIYLAVFPVSFPKVREFGERIPLEADRHICPDGTICFCTKTKEEIFLATKVITLNNFIQFILIPFLQNNSYFEIHKTYKFGEHSHHPLEANYETYVDILGIENLLVIEKTIDGLINRKRIRPNELCFCESRKKIKNCSNHQELYRLSRKIPKETLFLDKKNLQTLRKILIEHKGV